MPSDDVPESPTSFVAMTLAKTDSPEVRENGDASRVVIGIAQLGFAIPESDPPSQLTKSRAHKLSDFFK